MHRRRRRVRARTAKPIPGVVEIVLDAMNHAVNIGAIARGNPLRNSMRLVHSTSRNIEKAPYAPCFLTVCLCDFMVFGRSNPLNHPLIRRRLPGRNSRQVRIVKKISDEGRVNHSVIAAERIGEPVTVDQSIDKLKPAQS
jgi:hypothetical protein